MFEELLSAIKHFAERLAMFVFGLEKEREAGEFEKGVGRFVEVMANLALIGMVLSLITKAAWEGLSAPEARETMQAMDVGWGWALAHIRELIVLTLLAVLVLLATLTLLFWVRHVLSPSRLLTAWAIYEVGKVSFKLWTSEASWKDVLEKLAG